MAASRVNQDSFYGGECKDFNQKIFIDICNQYNALSDVKKVPCLDQKGSCFGLLMIWYYDLVNDAKVSAIDRLLMLQKKLEKKVRTPTNIAFIWQLATSIFSPTALSKLYNDFYSQPPSEDELSLLILVRQYQESQKKCKPVSLSREYRTIAGVVGSSPVFFKKPPAIPELLDEKSQELLQSIIILKFIPKIMEALLNNPDSLLEMDLVFPNGMVHICGAVARITKSGMEFLFFDSNIGEINFSDPFNFSHFLQKHIPMQYPDFKEMQFTVSPPVKLSHSLMKKPS